jgi:hypothetical protein
MEKEEKKEPKKKVIAAKKFADKTDGKVYEKGADITHLGEDRHAELKERGIVK